MLKGKIVVDTKKKKLYQQTTQTKMSGGKQKVRK